MPVSGTWTASHSVASVFSPALLIASTLSEWRATDASEPMSVSPREPRSVTHALPCRQPLADVAQRWYTNRDRGLKFSLFFNGLGSGLTNPLLGTTPPYKALIFLDIFIPRRNNSYFEPYSLSP